MAQKTTLRVPTNTTQVPPIIEVWVVERFDFEANQWEAFDVTCVAGTFLRAYAALGHVSGRQPFHPIEDLYDRRLVRRFRDIP